MVKNKETIEKKIEKKDKIVCKCSSKETGGAVYGLGFIGALVYYISTANSFWIGFLGFLKSIV